MNFEQALRIAGLMPREIVADGKIRRCPTETTPKKRNGWYALHLDGHGTWGDWTSGSGQALGTWKDDNATQQAVSPEVVAKMQAQRDRERQYRIQSVRSARAFWNKCHPLSLPHSYIVNKGLLPLGCAGVRTHDGLLVIPVMLGDSLISIQTITHDGVKKFWPGAPVKAGCFVMRRERAVITIFVEGFATGLAVYQSVRNSTVIVAFDAGNLMPVADRIRPKGSVVFAADNDHATQLKRGMNPGIEKATNAAELIGAGVAYPEGIEGSDWADYAREIGEGSARKIERQILAKAKYVVAS
ncbi:toprim domain-containing protein [Rhodoferax ferrireducens]|uniref:toprim domain-containing protein n=1 Tax=Rhodoferax ferrireducens TaxID=192843 RepID=UPI000E0D9F92|nr:toprim domain-containing protein [Rhodoferax ferrireducens]